MSMLLAVALLTTSVFATSVKTEMACASGALDGSGLEHPGMGSCLLQISRSASQGPRQVNLMQQDPWLDEDYPEDNQPNTTKGDSAEQATTPAPNVSQLQMYHAVDPPLAPAANASAAPPTNGTAASAKNETAVPVEQSANTIGNVSTQSNGTGVVNATMCATRKDPRAVAWFAETSPEGTPCIFGVDVRDEGKHCIFGGGQFGSNGYCFTAKDKSSWGSCNEHCPLFGPPAALGKKLDNVAKKVDQVADKLGGTTEAESAPDAAPAAVALGDAKATTTQTPLIAVTTKAVKA